MSTLGDAALTSIPVVGDFLAGQSNAAAVKDAYKHRYQWEVKDLKKAGLNPALAYGHQPGTPQVGTMPDLGSSAAQGYQAMKQGKVQGAQARLTNAQAGVLEAQAKDLAVETGLKNQLLVAQTQGQFASAAEARARIPFLEAQTRSEGWRAKSLEQQIAESQAKVREIGSRIGLNEAEIKKTAAVIGQIEQDMKWQRATWDVKLRLLGKELEQAGVNLSNAQLERLARSYGLAGQRAESDFYDTMGESGSTGARDFLRAILQFTKGAR